MRAVTPKKTREYEQLVEAYARRAAVEADGWRVGARVPLELEVLFVFRRPKNQFRICDEGGRSHKVTKGDLDNHIKAVLDGLQSADLFADDAQVVSIKAEKAIGTILNRREKAAEAPFALVTLRVLPALPGE
jgi:Holliday junction resolvase RusA-like endonuclease